MEIEILNFEETCYDDELYIENIPVREVKTNSFPINEGKGDEDEDEDEIIKRKFINLNIKK